MKLLWFLKNCCCNILYR